jgi:hypothetical protein
MFFMRGSGSVVPARYHRGRNLRRECDGEIAGGAHQTRTRNEKSAGRGEPADAI